MTHRRRRRLLAISCIALVGIVTALWLLLPRFAHDAIVEELRAQGFDDPELRVRGVGWGTIELADVRLGPDLAIDSLHAEIDLSTGAIESMTITGARWVVEPTLEALRASSVARLVEARGGGSGETAPRVVLSRAQLVVGGTDPIEVDGDVLPAEGRARLTVRSALGAHRIAVRSGADGEHTTLAVSARSSLDPIGAREPSLGGPAERAPGTRRPVHVRQIPLARGSRARDRAQVTARWSPTGPISVAAHAELGAGDRGSSGHTVRLESAQLDGHATIIEGAFDALELRARGEGVSIDQLAIGDVELSAARSGETIAWSASADAKADLDASIGGRAPLELARWNDPGPIEWEITGPIEGALLERALPGVVVDSDPRVALAGTVRRGGEGWALDAIQGTVQAPSVQVPGGDTAIEHLQMNVVARASIGAHAALTIDEGTTMRAARLDIDELHAHEIELAPVARVEAGEGRTTMTLDRDAVARMQRLSIGSGRAALHFDDTQMTLRSRDGQPIVDSRREAHVMMRLDADAQRVAGLLRGRRARGGGDLTVSMRTGDADISLPLDVRADELGQEDAELSLSAARVSLPLVWERGVLNAAGRMRARSMAWRGVAIGATSGAVRISPDAVRLAWRGPATGQASFTMRARIPFDEGRGAVDVTVPRAIAASGEPLQRVLAELTDMIFTGPVEGELHLDIDAPERGRARIVVSGADIAERDGSALARGVHGTLRFSQLSPLVSVAPDRVRWSALKIGDFVDTDAGSALLSFLPTGHVAIDGFDARVAGGRVRAAPLSFDWDEPDVMLDLRVEGIELGRLVRLLAGERARATGRLDGRVALRVRTGERRRVVLGDGRLVAREPGFIRIGDGRLEDFDTSNLDVLLEGDWLQQRLVSALSDFRYERLVLELDDSDGTRRLRARVVGRGRRTPQELDLTLNVRGVQPLIDSALRRWPDGTRRAQIEMSRR